MDTEECWHGRTDIEKENFMFHELGHALLSKSHSSVSFSNTYPKSVMCGGPQTRIGCNNYQTYYQNQEMRSYYLDELFGTITPDPDWVKNEFFVRNLFVDSIGATKNEWQTFIVNDENNLSQYEFQIDSSGIFPSNSLKMSIASESVDGSSFALFRRFEIANFTGCSSIKARADIRTENLRSGFVDIGISLREIDAQGELYRIAYHRSRHPNVSILNGQILETEIYCIPERSAVVTISFTMTSRSAANVYFDNIELGLWEN